MERFETELAYPNPAALSSEAYRALVLYDPDYRARIEKEAARLQAESVRRTVKAVGRFIGSLVLGAFRLVGMVARGAAAVRLYEELSNMDDATLAELGISREKIGQFVVDSMDATPSQMKAVTAGAGLSAIDGGRRGQPAASDELPRRRAA